MEGTWEMNVRMTRPLFGALGLHLTTMSAHAGRINPFHSANLVRRYNKKFSNVYLALEDSTRQRNKLVL